jgi:hypothetical protein
VTDPETALEYMAELAKVLDNDEYLDGTSPSMRRAHRALADDIRAALEKYGALTPPVLLSFWMGATAQAHVARATNPLASTVGKLFGQDAVDGPHITVTVATAYLSRDILAGERVA